MIKKFLVAFVFSLVLLSANDMYGKGNVVLGLKSGYWPTIDFSGNIVGGYHYSFSKEHQFSGFRHGIRGLGAIGYRNAGKDEFEFSGIVDWTLDFNIKDSITWGIFAGLGINVSSDFKNKRVEIFPAGNVGGAVTINNFHRLELSMEIPRMIGLKYLYMF